jgi:hypothetical protein
LPKFITGGAWRAARGFYGVDDVDAREQGKKFVKIWTKFSKLTIFGVGGENLISSENSFEFE